MFVDYISDIHVDSHVTINMPFDQQKKVIKRFVERFLPETRSKYLVVAGDIGHYNKQNILFFERLSNLYDKVFYTFGNHDLYLIFESEKETYKYHSLNRIENLRNETNKLGNVFLLDNEIAQVENKKIGGYSIWYDGSYGRNFYNLNDFTLHEVWIRCLNDFNFTYFNGTRVYFSKLMDELFKNQYEKLLNGAEECDLIFSHVPPLWNHIKPPYDNRTSAYFCFDGRKVIEKCANKTWIFGHTHVSLDYIFADCRFLCNPYGYPREKQETRIKNVEI